MTKNDDPGRDGIEVAAMEDDWSPAPGARMVAALAGDSTSVPMASEQPRLCEYPTPEGFRCTRHYNHVGPCALVTDHEFKAQPSQLPCETCGNTMAWHEEAQPRHAFNDGSTPFSATFGRRADRRTGQPGSTPQRGSETAAAGIPWPHDPVLRQALIDKGVLTPDDLTAAEAKIRVVSNQFKEMMQGGEQQGR